MRSRPSRPAVTTSPATSRSAPKTDTYQTAVGGTWTGDRVTLTTEVDYTNSHFSQDGYILDTQYAPPANGYTADFDYNGTGTPYMNVTGIKPDGSGKFPHPPAL